MKFKDILKPYGREVATILVLILLGNVFALALPYSLKIIIDDVVIRGRATLLNEALSFLLLIVGLKSGVNYFHKYCIGVLGEQVLCDIRRKIYWFIHEMSLDSVKSISPSQLMTRVSTDVESVKRFTTQDLFISFSALMNLIFIFGLLLFLNFKLTLIAILPIPFFIVLYLKSLPHLKNQHRDLRRHWAQAISRINEVIHGLAIMRAFSAENHEKDLFLKSQKEILGVARKTHVLTAGIWSLVELFSFMGIVFTLWAGAFWVTQGSMTPGELIAFYSYLVMVFAPIIQLVVINSAYQEALTGLDRINELFRLSHCAASRRSSQIQMPLQGLIEFREVFFAYPNGQQVLDGVSFAVKPGETLGIVGSSGVGKSTLVNLLLGFYEPQKGTICIDGIPLTQLSLPYYRKQLAVVLQDEFLFSGSIRDNILYGSDQMVTDCEIIQAAKQAQAHGFITRFEDSYSTQIGERGLRLSAGQRQRIALARALLKSPNLLILDEATSALDAITENEVQETLKHSMLGKTTLIVAHRFSSIAHADKIIVLDQGKVAETGDHNTLLSQGGFYSELYLEQF